MVVAARFPVLTITSSDWRSSAVKTHYVLFGHISTWMKTGATLPLSLVIILLTEH
jgi:hypothetical protein